MEEAKNSKKSIINAISMSIAIKQKQSLIKFMEIKLNHGSRLMFLKQKENICILYLKQMFRRCNMILSAYFPNRTLFKLIKESTICSIK